LRLVEVTKVIERITGDLLFRRPVCGLCIALLALWCSHTSEKSCLRACKSCVVLWSTP